MRVSASFGSGSKLIATVLKNKPCRDRVGQGTSEAIRLLKTICLIISQEKGKVNERTRKNSPQRDIEERDIHC